MTLTPKPLGRRKLQRRNPRVWAKKKARRAREEEDHREQGLLRLQRRGRVAQYITNTTSLIHRMMTWKSQIILMTPTTDPMQRTRGLRRERPQWILAPVMMMVTGSPGNPSQGR